MYSNSHIRILGFKVKLKLFSLKLWNYSADILSGFERQHNGFCSNPDVAIIQIAGLRIHRQHQSTRRYFFNFLTVDG